MIVFASCVGGDGTKFRSVSLPSIEALREPEDLVLTRPGTNGICEVYNHFIDVCRDRDDVEALVLLHDDVELRDPNFRKKVLDAVAEPGVGIVGVIGARNLIGLEWWHARYLAGRVEEPRGLIDHTPRSDDVDVVDGLMIIMSPAAIHRLRFDESTFPAYHGYDADICLQAREARLRVVTRDIDVFHRTKGGFGNRDAFHAAARALEEKWDNRVTPLNLVERSARRTVRGVRRLRDLATHRTDPFREPDPSAPAQENPTPPTSSRPQPVEQHSRVDRSVSSGRQGFGDLGARSI